jgi:anti-anti-sigma factor
MEQHPLEISTETRPGASIVHVKGDVTASCVDPMRQAVAGAIASKTPRLVIDLSGTTFLSSPGLAVLVQAMQLVKRGGGTLVLAGPNDRVRGIFEIARLTDVFTIVPTLEAALGA